MHAYLPSQYHLKDSKMCLIEDEMVETVNLITLNTQVSDCVLYEFSCVYALQ